MTGTAPLNAVEAALAAAQADQSALPAFLNLFVQSEIAVVTGGEIAPDGRGFQPMMFDKEGVPMVACFTAIERIGAYVKTAPNCLQINCAQFLSRIPGNFGLVVNPGHQLGFELSPDGLKQVVAELNRPQPG